MNEQANSNTNFVSIVADLARRRGYGQHIAFVEGDRSITYSELLKRSAGVGAALRNLGITSGTRVTVLMPEGIDFVSIFLGILHTGAVAMPVNAWLGEDAVSQAVTMADSDVTVVGGGTTTTVGQILRAEDLLDRASETEAAPTLVGPEDFAIGLFTSGTTGPAKVCYHTHGDILAISAGAGEAIGILPEDVCMSASGLHFSYGLGNLVFFPLLRGATSALTGLSRRMTADEAFDKITAYNVTVFSAIPSYFLRLLNSPRSPELTTLRIAATGGEVLGKTLEDRLRAAFGPHGLVNIFGSTEIGHAVVVNRSADYVAGATGRVVDGYEVRVIDSDGRPCPQGTVGALQAKGPSISVGVKRGNEDPRRVIHEWFSMGDAARINADGTVSVLGRMEDIETIGGVPVYPAEVESEILAIDGVTEAAVFVASVDEAPSLVALIVTSDPPTSADPGTLWEAIAQRMRGKRAPDVVHLVGELPHLSGGGKLARRTIREEWRQLIRTSEAPESHRPEAVEAVVADG